MLKSIIINLFLIKSSLSFVSPPSPPGSQKWIYSPPKNRTIRTFSYIDECGNSGQTMLSLDQNYVFGVSTSISNKLNYQNNTNVVLHALSSSNGNEIWNSTISNDYINGKLYISSTLNHVISGYSFGNNSLNITVFNLYNGSQVWNKIVNGTSEYNVKYLSLFRTVSKENRIIMTPPTDWRGKPLLVYDILTGNSIRMQTTITYPSSIPIFINDLQSIVYTVGDGSSSNINSNWLSNGTIRTINFNCNGGNYGVSIKGADNSFIVLDCPIQCHVDCDCVTNTNIYSFKKGESVGSIQICGGGGAIGVASGVNWIQSLGDGYLLFSYYHGNTNTISLINENFQGYKWSKPSIPGKPVVFLPKQNIILLSSNSDPNSINSQLYALALNNGSIIWSSNLDWSLIKKSGYNVNYDVDSCLPSTYSLHEDNTSLILIDTHYNGHAISLNNGSELYNISISIIPDDYNKPYPPPDTLSIISSDATTIYSLVPKNLKNNGYILATNVGNNCDLNHYGQLCNKTCKCNFNHGIKKCDSGVFGTGTCSGSCDDNWSGEKCDDCKLNYYGNNCSKYTKCYMDLNTPYGYTGGICDCGVNGTGHCKSCYPRYGGLDCNDCSNEYFGKYCLKTCTCKYGTNFSGINGTGICKYCDNIKWSGDNCDLCHGKPDAPQCGIKYKQVDCLDPISGKSIREGCPSMCNSCPDFPPNPNPTLKYKCTNNMCTIVPNNSTGGGTLTQCQNICGKGYWHCINGYCLPSTNTGLNWTQCNDICRSQKKINYI